MLTKSELVGAIKLKQAIMQMTTTTPQPPMDADEILKGIGFDKQADYNACRERIVRALAQHAPADAVNEQMRSACELAAQQLESLEPVHLNWHLATGEIARRLRQALQSPQPTRERDELVEALKLIDRFVICYRSGIRPTRTMEDALALLAKHQKGEER